MSYLNVRLPNVLIVGLVRLLEQARRDSLTKGDALTKEFPTIKLYTCINTSEFTILTTTHWATATFPEEVALPSNVEFLENGGAAAAGRMKRRTIAEKGTARSISEVSDGANCKTLASP